jgi:hypothetical protein
MKEHNKKEERERVRKLLIVTAFGNKNESRKTKKNWHFLPGSVVD